MLRSRFALSAILLCVLCALFFVVSPPSQPNALKNVEDILATTPTCDCVLVGSSQWLCPSFFCDTVFHGHRERFDDSTALIIDSYNESDYFESLLRARGVATRILNFAVPGAVAKDDLSMVKRLSERPSRERLLLCG